MIAAIYARKSPNPDAATIADDAKSVTRQVEHAREYAQRKGWTVDEAHVYTDDQITGAIFGAGRPALARLLNALAPRPAFHVLVMSDGDRLGRESIETGWTLKQILDAGVRVFTYLDDRERTLDTAMDKVMLSLSTFAAEMEREKARQRTHDALVRRARAGHVAGGLVYGYQNREITAPDGRRSHVVREIHAEQAAVVRRIFEWYADGAGIVRIAKRLNAEGTPPPRARGWAPSAVREMLRRDLYRGVITWNRSAKDVRGGHKRQHPRDEREWIRREAPELAIVSPELAAAVDARLRSAASAFPRGVRGALTTGGAVQAPGYASPYILWFCPGFVDTKVMGHCTGTLKR